MRVTHLSTFAQTGGAARAALRLHRALLEVGSESFFLTTDRSCAEPFVGTPDKYSTARHYSHVALNRLVAGLEKTANPALHSPSLFGTSIEKDLNRLRPTVINLHWLQASFLSIEAIGRILAHFDTYWTLHDEWAFSGCEHLGAPSSRIEQGYTHSNRASATSWLDINRFVWRKKEHSWSKPATIICPSKALASKVKTSRLMGEWPVQVIPNAIDTDVFRPLEPQLARQLLQLPDSCPILLFGAANGIDDYNKGFDILRAAVDNLLTHFRDLKVLLVGRIPDDVRATLGSHFVPLGQVNSDLEMTLSMNASDVVVVPSRSENLPQMATEAHACGRPVAAFRVGGMEDVVIDGLTGCLADPFSSESLAKCIRELLDRDLEPFSRASRLRAETLWSKSTVADAYLKAYDRSAR